MLGRPVSEPLLRAVGLRVRELRLARGLTQERLAETLGVATQYVQGIERGARNLTLVTVGRVAEALEVEPFQLFVPPQASESAGRPGRPTKEYRQAHAGPVTVAVLERPVDELPWGHSPKRPRAKNAKKKTKARARRLR